MDQNEPTHVPKWANSKNRTNLLVDLTEKCTKNNPGYTHVIVSRLTRGVIFYGNAFSPMLLFLFSLPAVFISDSEQQRERIRTSGCFEFSLEFVVVVKQKKNTPFFVTKKMAEEAVGELTFMRTKQGRPLAVDAQNYTYRYVTDQ